MGGGCGCHYEETKKTAEQIAQEHIEASRKRIWREKIIVASVRSFVEIVVFVSVFLLAWRLLFNNENIYGG